MKYIIGSGWWCADNPSLDDNEFRIKYGDDEIRGKDFHHVWYDSVNTNTNPSKIVIVDSCSPTKPPLDRNDPRIEFISLNENPGHSTKHTGKYSGWTRSVLLGLSYAINCDCDYFVYVEQDALLKGKGIIEREIANMKRPFVFGKQRGLAQPLQQSFFIIDMKYAELFLSRYMAIKARDNKISPERKFAIATSAILGALPESLFYQPPLNNVFQKVLHRVQSAILKVFGCYGVTVSGYGRDRPIKFDDEYFYFQHGSKEELQTYLETQHDAKR
ncbi:hypothetical protein OE749_01020 [Aestuariibacter sp. AA17]|uniref:Glycosyltransferase n=1 Tax=Fluctibacter corallii TaxID=2984329 RepID=A0ABT3A3M2_9ALTE|nr:hypothetical protein [Aestuariibacter sp. AA17]MCV2883275.1 hypothetical protein [Aestuariibacter sp. AA17]